MSELWAGESMFPFIAPMLGASQAANKISIWVLFTLSYVFNNSCFVFLVSYGTQIDRLFFRSIFFSLKERNWIFTHPQGSYIFIKGILQQQQQKQQQQQGFIWTVKLISTN